MTSCPDFHYHISQPTFLNCSVVLCFGIGIAHNYCNSCKNLYESKLKKSSCDKNFQNNLINHEENQLEETPFSCQKCDETFSTKNILTMHEIIHNSEKAFSCFSCGNTSERSDPNTFKSDDKPFNCSSCEKELVKENGCNLIHPKFPASAEAQLVVLRC